MPETKTSQRLRIKCYKCNPLRLSFEPAAIREHFADTHRELYVDRLSSADLLELGNAAMNDGDLWRAYHDALVDALDTLVSKRPALAKLLGGK